VPSRQRGWGSPEAATASVSAGTAARTSNVEGTSGGRRREDFLAVELRSFSKRLAWLVGGSAIAGILLVGGYAWTQGQVWIFMVGALVALAATVVGAFLGFLFGLPRFNPVTTVSTPIGSSPPAAGEAPATSEVRGGYAPSNNLEQISDWFTKLLLGAGLVQLGHIGSWLGSFVVVTARGFTPSKSGAPVEVGRVVVASVLAFYFGFGFLFGYIDTTLWYSIRLDRVVHPRSSSGPSHGSGTS
jgi:hypothetical protein